ncbi:MAG: vitamin K epoxide reductase family protein [Armatimonadota bacterium]
MEQNAFWYGVILAAGLVGLVNAALFTAMIYGWLALDSPLLTRVCRVDSGDCHKVINSPRARLFGVPNSVLGVVWYLLAASFAATALVTGSLPLPAALLALSTLTVVVGIYLIWSLRFRLQVHCWFCYLGHATNFIIFAGLLAAR